MSHLVEAGTEIHFKAGSCLTLEAAATLTLKVGSNFLVIDDTGVTIVGTKVMINSGGSPGTGTASSPTAPSDADKAAPVAPTVADTSKPGNVSTGG